MLVCGVVQPVQLQCVQYSLLLLALVNVSVDQSGLYEVYTHCGSVELTDMTGLTKLKLVRVVVWPPHIQYRPSDYNSCLTTNTSIYKLDK